MMVDFVILVAPFWELADSHPFAVLHRPRQPRPLQTRSSRINTYYFMASNTILQNSIGTTISGNAQVINAGRDVNIVHGPPAGTLRLYFIHLFHYNSLYLGLSQSLRPVSNTTHTRSGPVAKCDPGTRLKVIDTIKQWLNRRDKRSVCWLNGPAGYGKSALSQTIAERYADKAGF
jgi:hypothetical protein